MLFKNINYMIHVYIQSREGCECIYRPLAHHVFSHGILALSKYYLKSFALGKTDFGTLKTVDWLGTGRGSGGKSLPLPGNRIR
jgi:hypothetical protein